MTSRSNSHSLAGDYDADGDVDGRDFLTWQRIPSIGDLADWQANYGVGSVSALRLPPSALDVMPEPTSAIMLLLCIVGYGTRSTAPRRPNMVRTNRRHSLAKPQAAG